MILRGNTIEEAIEGYWNAVFIVEKHQDGTVSLKSYRDSYRTRPRAKAYVTYLTRIFRPVKKALLLGLQYGGGTTVPACYATTQQIKQDIRICRIKVTVESMETV